MIIGKGLEGDVHEYFGIARVCIRYDCSKADSLQYISRSWIVEIVIAPDQLDSCGIALGVRKYTGLRLDQLKVVYLLRLKKLWMRLQICNRPFNAFASTELAQ